MIKEFNFEKNPIFTTKYQKTMIQECFAEHDNMELLSFIKTDKRYITALIRIDERSL